MQLRRITTVGTIALAGFLGACNREVGSGTVRNNTAAKPRPLTAQDFVTRQQAADSGNPLDQKSRAEFDQVGLNLLEERRAAEAEPGPLVDGVSDTVDQAIQSPLERANATTRPAKGRASGQYMTIGGVIADVNGQPIYIDKVLQSLETQLAAVAKESNQERFKTVAADLIEKRVWELVRDELEYAAATKNLDANDRKLAERLTTDWRQKKITDAGGSIGQAKDRAAAEGYTFDELVNEQFRTYMTQIYYEKRVLPRIQVSADDMRRFYNQNKTSLFTERQQAKFRLIKIDVAKSGGGDRDKAFAKAKDLYEKAKRGDDFAELARTNDDASLIATNGDVGWVDKGAWANEKVEKAVWETPINGVTDIIDSGKAFFIARVEDKKDGRVIPFEDQTVQIKIREKLRSDQFARLRDEVQKKLQEDAIIRPMPTDRPAVAAAMAPAIEMAMQRYPQWASAQ